MGADDPREVALAFLTAPACVTAQTKGPGGWVASTGGGGLDALPESVVFVKERHLPSCAAYDVRFTTRAGMRMRYTLSPIQGNYGAWQVLGGAGGAAEDQPENAPKRGHPYANLGGGDFSRQFYAGGAIEEDNGAVARARLHSANGVELEDTLEQSEVLFLSDDAIYYEDLQTANMVRNHHLARSIQDAGWAAFLSILTYKAACAGRLVVAVPPAFTSQRCSGCDVLISKGLSMRWHSCPDCGTSLHRDHNAAKNMERAGQARRGGVAVAAAKNRESPLGECQTA